MLVSAVLSIHNRGLLFARALTTYLWQTLPRQDWEILLLDDGSTEDLREAYVEALGEINLRHVRMDTTRHALFKQRNPGWTPDQPKDWFHTPALSLNLGAYMARGEVLCLCHPEILHAPENFERAAWRTLRERAFLFGKTYLGTPRTNVWLEDNPDWPALGWEHFVHTVNRPVPLQAFGPTELYWYTSFLPRQAFLDTGGVDFEFLNGVAGEDDDFRDRVKLAGYEPVHAPEIQGLHQDHSNELEPHRIRSSPAWKAGLARNRKTYYDRRDGKAPYPQPANAAYDWRAIECAVRLIEYRVGSKEPVKHLLEGQLNAETLR